MVDNEFLVESLIFQKVEKPKNFAGIKVVNVYDNRYRVNIYHNIEEEGLHWPKKRMFSSFFCILRDNDELVIAYPDLSKPKAESRLTPTYR